MEAVAIVPASVQSNGSRSLAVKVRVSLVLMAVAIIGVFALARWLDPYDADGMPRRFGTHRQLGMPTCTFLAFTKMPCPSCGMTTSFSLLFHGDIGNSLRVNFAGTLMAALFAVAIPWSLASAVMGRLLGIRSVERTVTWFVVGLIGLLVARWLIVVLILPGV
jgi:hypothetical protein